MGAVLSFLRARAENVAAAMLAAMFLTFLLQIFGRYVLAEPFGWTLELCLMLWVWIVFWGCAFVVREQDHVTFDLLYQMAPRRIQRVFALVSAAAIVVGFAIALWPTWDYVDFLKIKRSATLRLPLRTVFSIYVVFMVAVIAAYAIRFVAVWRKGPPPREEVGPA
jgi:C4-dicarboxylate transporter DctQ subunit